MNPKTAGKAFESEIEEGLLELVNQTRDIDIRERTHRIFTSGSQQSDEGDVITNIPELKKQFLIECKRRRTSTNKWGPHLDVEIEWLHKIVKEAEKRKCEPLFIGSFTGCKRGRIFVICTNLNFLPYSGFTTVCNVNKKSTSFRVSRNQAARLNGTVSRLSFSKDIGLKDWRLASWDKFKQILKLQIGGDE